ncbi:hypothetical protein [Staphylococcus debuckii]|uniref:Peptidase n=1 Tax=Staphylococcus debuckii TaxID=2044912 RepID=A0ABU9EYT5_9STAP|nr:hypothetical protein [Staphylococcus debuckii]AYU55506.1 hypothetical protein CNQ82_08555 [Staphylococcus debuckii]
MSRKKIWLLIVLPITLLVSGVLVYLTILSTKKYDPFKLIEEVKSYFMNVTGSYIVSEPQPFEQDGIAYEVYRGGVTTENHGKVSNYEFVADATNGKIINIKEV